MESNNIEKLYKDYVTDIYRYSFARLQNRTDAEDVVSEAFYRALVKSKLVKNTAEITKQWLIVTARNIIHEKYRENNNTTNLSSLDDIAMVDIDQEIAINDKLITEENIAEVQSAFSNLAEDTREILILKVGDDYKFNQIAEIVHSSLSAVKMRYYRGLEELQAILEGSNTKKMALSIPAIYWAFKSLAHSNNYQIPSNLFNLVTKKYMENTSGSSNAVNSAAFNSGTSALKTGIVLAPAAKIAAIVASGIILVGGIAGVATIRNNASQIKPVPESLPQSYSDQQNVASSPTNNANVNITPVSVVNPAPAPIYGADWVRDQYKFNNTVFWDIKHPKNWAANTAGLS